MAIIKINTSNLESDGKRINELAHNYNQLVNDMFDRLDFGIANAWNGESSIKYRSTLAKDRDFFLKLGAFLKDYGDELINISDDFDKKIRKWDNYG